nr:hypothetical protein [uncultured bacterium]
MVPLVPSAQSCSKTEIPLPSLEGLNAVLLKQPFSSLKSLGWIAHTYWETGIAIFA